jgi:hypothetical protein
MDATATAGTSERMAARLREFLRTLPVETCARILDALDRAREAGEAFPGAELIDRELRSIVRATRQAQPRNLAQRHFFAVLEPFLTDEALPFKRAARIERASLPPIWNWLSRDIVPADFAAYAENVAAALARQDVEKARTLTAKLHRSLVPIARAALHARGDEAQQRKVAAQVGGQRVVDDLRDMLVVLENRDVLKSVAERIAGPIKQLDDAHASTIIAALAPHARGNATMMPHAVAIAMTRLAAPWQIVRVAALAAESHEVAKILSTPFGVIIEMLVADVERLVLRAEAARQAHNVERVASAAKDFAHHVRALVTDLELSPDLAQSKRVAAMRSRMAQLLRPEIETLPGRVRRVLKARTPDGGKRGETLDETEIASLEAGLDILLLAKSHAAELALNEVTLRVFSDLQGFLDAGVNPLLDSMRGMAGEERAYRLQQLDAAVKIAYRVLGPSYATLLAKAVDVAAGDRKAARPG